MSRFRCQKSKVFISNAVTLGFCLIIDQKNFGGEKDEKLKSCDAGSSNGKICKLSEGVVYFIISVSTLTVISKIKVYKVRISLNNVSFSTAVAWHEELKMSSFFKINCYYCLIGKTEEKKDETWELRVLEGTSRF